MSNSDLELIKKALLEVQGLEIRAIDTLPTVDFTHSEKYNEKISAILRGDLEASHTPWGVRKIAAVIIAAILLVACSVTVVAFRKPIKKLITDIYENFVILSAPDDDEEVPTSIETVYTISNVPDGFTQIQKHVTDLGTQITWFRNDSEILVFGQSVQNNTTIRVDGENSENSEIYIGDRVIYRVYKNNMYSLSWIENGYIFFINCSDTVSWEEIELMISNLIPDPEYLRE